MYGISVSAACGAEQTAVVSNGSSSCDDVVLAVAIDISHAYAVYTLGEARLSVTSVQSWGRRGAHHPMCGCQSLVEPSGGQALSVPVDSPKVASGVVPSLHDGAWQMVCSVEVGYGGIIAVATVEVGVAPCLWGVCSSFGWEIYGCTIGTVEYGVQGLSCHAFEDRQKLLSVAYMTIGIDMHFGIVTLGDALRPSCFRHVSTRAVCSARSCLADEFSLAVAIKVVDKEGRVVAAGAYIQSKVDAPQVCAIHAVGIIDGRGGHSVVPVIPLVGGRPFQNEFVGAVAIEVAYAHVVGAVIA